jgi:peroxiredoxin
MNRFATILALGAMALLPAVAAEVPRRAPEFAIQMPQPSGQNLLSQYKGKVVCVEFLYTTCPHCQTASQLMSRLQTEYGPRGFQALGVAFNEMSHMLVRDFVRDFKVNYPIGFSTREPVHAFLQNDPKHSLHVPQMVFIDRKGVIRHQSLAQADSQTSTEPFMRKMIETLLKEPAPAATPAKRPKSASTKKSS